MLQQRSAKGTTKSRVRFPGICADAAALGVRRETLWRLLTGEWKLPSLRSRYEELKSDQAKARAA